MDVTDQAQRGKERPFARHGRILLRRSLPTFRCGPRFVSIQHRCTTEVRCTPASLQWTIGCVSLRHIFPAYCTLPSRIQWKAAAHRWPGKGFPSELGPTRRTLTSVPQLYYDRQPEGDMARELRDSEAHCAECRNSGWWVIKIQK